MILALLLFFIGLLLSGFFSGTETGMYRVSRTRLVLDGLSGSRPAQGIVWLLNHPAIFVATALIGNNLANYLVSLAIVMASASLFGGGSAAELIGPMLMTPIVFVFGELLPKYHFFHAPYRLITATRSLLLTFSVLFAPISLVLGVLGLALQRITGQAPFPLRLAMARRELEQVLRHGQEAGILAPGQRLLAQRLFEVGNQPAISFAAPIHRFAVVDAPVEVTEARYRARRSNHPIVLVRRAGRIVGFLWYADLCAKEPQLEWNRVVRARVEDRHLQVLLRLYDAGSEVAILRGEGGSVKSVVTRRQLVQPMIK